MFGRSSRKDESATSMDWLKAVADCLEHRVFVKARNLEYVLCNASMAADLGLTREGCAGKTDYDLFPAELADKYRADDEAVMASGEAIVLEETYSMGGEERDVRTTKTPVRDASGEVIGVIGQFYDVTAQRRAEREHREAEEKYRNLFEFSPEPIFINNPDGTGLLANQAFVELCGYSKEELAGINTSHLYADPEDRETLVVNLQQTGRVHDEVRFRRKDGSTLVCERTVVSQKDKDGNVVAFQGMLRDRTAQKLAEHAMNERRKELECLYGVSGAAEIADKDLGAFLQRVTELLTEAYQYSEDTAARIIIEGDEYRSVGFIDTPNKQTAEIRVDEEVVGSIEVGYRSHHPEDAEGPFLAEERKLMDSVAERVGRVVQRVRTQEALRAHRDNLEQLVASRTAELERQSDLVRRQAEEILEISTPVMQVTDGVLVAPLIGTLDSTRTQLFMDRLLESIVETGATAVLVDITGVPTVDTVTAQHLIDTITAVRLLGARVILTGVRPAIAQTLVHLGVDLSSISTRSSLAAGLKLAVASHNAGERPDKKQEDSNGKR